AHRPHAAPAGAGAGRPGRRLPDALVRGRGAGGVPAGARHLLVPRHGPAVRGHRARRPDGAGAAPGVLRGDAITPWRAAGGRRRARGETGAAAERARARRALIRHYRVAARKVRVWQNGVDAERFRPRPPDAELLRELGLSPGTPVVLSAARFAPMKNLPFLVRA